MSSSRHSRADPPATDPEGRRRRLDSWKEIASFLGRSEKTVRRWEETEGLPVHRLYHERRASVYAYTAELEQWRETRNMAVESEPASGEEAAERNNEAPPFPLNAVGKTPRRTVEQWRLWPITALMTLISGTGLLAVIYWARSHVSARGTTSVRIESLAVLPFKNISGSTDQEYFADGMTEELIAAPSSAGRPWI